MANLRLIVHSAIDELFDLVVAQNKFAKSGPPPSEVGLAVGDVVRLKKGKTRTIIQLETSEATGTLVTTKHKRTGLSPEALVKITAAGHEDPPEKHHWHPNDEILWVLTQAPGAVRIAVPGGTLPGSTPPPTPAAPVNPGDL